MTTLEGRNPGNPYQASSYFEDLFSLLDKCYPKNDRDVSALRRKHICRLARDQVCMFARAAAMAGGSLLPLEEALKYLRDCIDASDDLTTLSDHDLYRWRGEEAIARACAVLGRLDEGRDVLKQANAYRPKKYPLETVKFLRSEAYFAMCEGKVKIATSLLERARDICKDNKMGHHEAKIKNIMTVSYHTMAHHFKRNVETFQNPVRPTFLEP